MNKMREVFVIWEENFDYMVSQIVSRFVVSHSIQSQPSCNQVPETNWYLLSSILKCCIPKNNRIGGNCSHSLNPFTIHTTLYMMI